MKKIIIGELVYSISSEYVGTITKIHKQCPMSNKWLANLSKPVTAQSVRSRWYSIDVFTGGSICQPEYQLIKI